jgi:hypothetical protein
MPARKLKPSEPESPAIPQTDQPGGDTSWKNGVPESGWYKMPDAWWQHLPRLQRGLYQRMLIEYVWGTTVPRKQGAKMPEWSPWMSFVEIAAIFRCSPEQVRDDAKDAGKRGLMMVERPAGSRNQVRFKVCSERWCNLKDYEPGKPVEMPEKKRVEPSSRWLAGISVKPGGNYDFVVPALPEDFRLQKISFRNTGESGEVVFAGGGPAEGGILIFETQTAVANKDKSAEQPKSTPVNVAQDDSNKRRSQPKSTPVKSNPYSKEKPATDPIVQQIAEGLGTYGPVTIQRVTQLIAACRATPGKVLESLSVVKPPENARDDVAWMLGYGIPEYLAGRYVPAKKKVSARDRRALDAMRFSRELKEGKIA